MLFVAFALINRQVYQFIGFFYLIDFARFLLGTNLSAICFSKFDEEKFV